MASGVLSFPQCPHVATTRRRRRSVGCPAGLAGGVGPICAFFSKGGWQAESTGRRFHHSRSTCRWGRNSFFGSTPDHLEAGNRSATNRISYTESGTMCRGRWLGRTRNIGKVSHPTMAASTRVDTPNFTKMEAT